MSNVDCSVTAAVEMDMATLAFHMRQAGTAMEMPGENWEMSAIEARMQMAGWMKANACSAQVSSPL